MCCCPHSVKFNRKKKVGDRRQKDGSQGQCQTWVILDLKRLNSAQLLRQDTTLLSIHLVLQTFIETKNKQPHTPARQLYSHPPTHTLISLHLHANTEKQHRQKQQRRASNRHAAENTITADSFGSGSDLGSCVASSFMVSLGRGYTLFLGRKFDIFLWILIIFWSPQLHN